MRKALLVCGIISSLYYVAVNAYVPTQWGEYSVASQTVSELSAIDAPTRPLWLLLVLPYPLLLVAFGVGVWLSAASSRARRFAGGALIAHGVVGLYWPPMHLRGAVPGMPLTDILHIVWAAVTLLLMLVAIVSGALALGRRFRIYSGLTLIVFLVFGTLTGMEGPRIAANLPTPWIGVWERINIAAFMLWVVVFAVELLRRQPKEPRSDSPVGEMVPEAPL